MKACIRNSLLAATALASTFGVTAYTQETSNPPPAEPAKEEIPVVVVTADKFAKSIQKTPIAVSVVSGQDIQQQGRTKIDDVLVNQPATIVQGAAKGYLVSIRGLGLSLPPQMGQGAVSSNYDGAFSSRAENASAGFYDLDRVEVLRGPQATLYGRNSVGGVVNIISRDPSVDSVGGYITAEAGTYSLGHLEGAFNVPLSEKVAFRISGSAVNRDGYVSNAHDDNVAQAARAKLLFLPSETSKLIVGVEAAHLGGKGPGSVPLAPGQQLPDNRTTNDSPYGGQDVDSNKVWLTYTAEIGPGRLFIQPSRQETKGTVVGAFGGNFANSADPKLNRQNALEVRYSSKAGAHVEWNLGYYHYDSLNEQQALSGACQDTAGYYEFRDDQQFLGPPGIAAAGACANAANWAPVTYLPDIRKNITDGLFGQVTVPVMQSTRLILGARTSKEKVRGENNNNVALTLPNIDDSHFDYRVGFETTLSSTSLMYGTMASGYRQGGYGFDNLAFAPEKMVSYEVGSKNRFRDGTVLFNADVFYYDYDSFQLVLADFSNFPPQINVKTMPAREIGVELEAQALVGENGRINGSLVYLDSKLHGKDGLFIGAPFPNSPKLSFKLGFAYDFFLPGGKLTPRLDLRAVGEQYVYPDENQSTDVRNVQPSYTTGDVSLLYRPDGGKWTFNAYVKNVNDAYIKQSHFFGYAQLAAPRTYGLVVTRNF